MEPVPQGIFILSLDISERKTREKERQQRIEETQRLLYKISHEVRQPVVNIQGLTNLIKDNMVQGKELATIADMMNHSVTILDERTRDLSTYISSLNFV